MTSIPSVSQSELSQRRRVLRGHRRLKLFHTAWQTIAASGILGGLVWATTQPIWVLRKSNQVIIEGNQLLSKQVIQTLIPLAYPQSLLRIQPEAIARSLEAQPTIANANVTRQLFPPGLRVQVKERLPVALVLTKSTTGITPDTKASVGLLDKTGVWIPIQSYSSSASSLKLPKLKVVTHSNQTCPDWTQLYHAVSHSPILVSEINCQDPANLIFKTALGVVHFGAYSSQLTQKLKLLDEMRQLTAHLKPSQIEYIDLKNLEAPLVQLHQAQEVVKLDTP